MSQRLKLVTITRFHLRPKIPPMTTCSPGPDSPYLIVQRQFEAPDDRKCYVEPHDHDYVGHYCLRLIDFSPTRLAIQIERKTKLHIEVCCIPGCGRVQRGSAHREHNLRPAVRCWGNGARRDAAVQAPFRTTTFLGSTAAVRGRPPNSAHAENPLNSPL
jgi:hypothetical protein